MKKRIELKRLRYIGFLIATLLLLGGMVTEAWADDVTYIILTKEFNVKMSPSNASYNSSLPEDAPENRYRSGIRLEALRCTSSGTTVYLPDAFRSPLAKNFKYWKAATKSDYQKLYDDTGTSPKVLQTTYEIYSAVATEMTENSTLESNGNPTIIYVTYEYNEDNTILKLDGEHKYNITLNTGDKLRYLCFNKNRNNRPAAALASTVSAEDLVSDDFVQNVGGFDGTKMVHYQFYLCGEDPYNITIMTAYEGDEIFTESLDVEKNTNYKKPFKGSTIFAKLNNNNNNDGTANMWLSPDAHRHYKSSSAVEYDSWEGFYKSNMNPIFNAVAVLPKGTGYFFVASKLNQNSTVYQPNASGYYATLADDGKNPRMLFKAIASAVPMEPDPVKTYTFKVKTPFGNVISVDKEWSDAYASQSLITHTPDALQRKYVTFTGAYIEESLSTPLTTFADAYTNATVVDGKIVVWLKYTASMPFDALPSDGSYLDARWYTMRMNGDHGDQYIVRYDSSNDKFNTGGGSNSNIHTGENSPEAMVAFIGDPFELRIINRKASETTAANRYIGCPTDAADATNFSSRASTNDIVSWEIEGDGISGTFVLRQYGTYASPKYIGWHYGDTGNPIYYKTTASRIKVVALEKKNYVYHIINSAGNIAVKMTEAQDVGTPLRLSSIPELIRSPFLALSGVNIFYYWSNDDYEDDETAVAGGGSRTKNKTCASYNPAEEGYDIYVTYTGMATALASTRVHFHTDQFFNVNLNGQYLYFYKDGEGNININSKVTITDEEAGSDAYKWRLEGRDPYDMKVYNEGAYRDNESAAEAYINTTFANDEALSFDVAGNAKSFVALSGTIDKTFEVMAATGDDEDIATDYLHIGLGAANSVKMLNKASAPHGSGSITFVLTQPDANVVYYHLIDKNNTDLLQVRNRYELLYFPANYRSPLVVQYHYYPTNADALAGTNELTENDSISTLKDAGTIQDRNSDAYLDVYVTYDVTDAVDMLNKKTMYLLKFTYGTPFRAEDGSDGLEETPVTPVYPYCNGDCNFFVYGQDQFDLQQQGAASTRTRWAWFLESANNDPYHVKICSRQTETYNTDELRAYFCTYQPTDYSQVVTGLVWPSISGIQGTEYMILGTTLQSRLVTSDSIALDADHNGTPESRQRYTVTSFEQYWKTYDTVRRKILKQGANDYPANPDEPQTVPHTPYVVGDANYTSNRDYLTDEMQFHSYSKWAYAKRWNGYNSVGKTSKGWEEIEHWFQTVEMGEGYFTLVPIDINPVLILLDQHGWEIMRKPLPTSPDDITKEDKYDAIRPYDSPMVKEYYFWTKASKRSGFHQYYNLSQQVHDNGKPFTSTSLTDLPPYYTATNLRDAKGNHLDEYVTYTVKDEYIQTYNTSTGEGQPFLIQQGSHFAYNNSNAAAIGTANVPATGGMSQYIISNAAYFDVSEGTKRNELWYVKPNARIDYEMGYVDSTATTTLNHDWTNDYTGAFSNGFDPYNIQISSVASNTKYFVTNATGATLEEGAGSLKGRYDDVPAVALGSPEDDIPCSWYDSRALAITNATFMAVQDAAGNMQLMPRFDHDRRMKDFATLTPPTDPDIDQTFTHLYRPLVYNYHIIDNQGRESLRYRSGGDLVPQTPDHFKSPLATDFQYFTTLTDGVVSGEITESLARAELTTVGSDGNDVYVRYSYADETDGLGILQGRWLTMTLNNLDAVYSSGIKQGTSKPATIDGDAKSWQWKLLATPQSTPDPYAVQLFNRNNKGNELPTGKRFAILSHAADGSYALAEAGRANDNYDKYYFLNGGGTMATDVAATIAQESGFLSTSCTFSGTNSQIMLTDEVTHEFTYNIYTNEGKFAISATQDNASLVNNEYEPKLPEAIISPLLNADQFRYYNKDNFTFTDGNITAADTTGKALTHVFGLYDDEICVRYTAYDPLATSYKVPNERNATDAGQVERANTSNDASIGINNEYLYNIIWHSDNMMTGNSDNTITSNANQELGGSPSGQVWYFAGNDPYAIKLRTSVGEPATDKYVYKSGETSCGLTATEGSAASFMLLPREDNYEYGMLQITGANERLTGYGNTLTTDAPTKFIIFALSTHMVTYHLVIANIGNKVTLYNNSSEAVITVDGTTQRDLSTNPIAPHAAGHVSLGDPFKVPTSMYRRNVDYFYYVGDIYNVNASGIDDGINTSLTSKYKGKQVTAMEADADLIGKHVHIYIVYTFQGGLATNAGDGFVLNVTQNKWYTFEAQKADGTPLLTQFTNAWGMEVKEGRGTHYTNDYLWSPIGDPYGFKMFHRYTYVNSGGDNKGEPHRVMTTIDNSSDVPAGDGPFVEEKPVTMGYSNDVSDPNSVYELLADEGTTPGYFKIHPVANSDGTQYYFKIFHDYENPLDDSTPEHDYVRLSSDDDYTEFRFGLTEDLVKPYYDRAGYVGGLTTAAKADYEAVDSNPSYTSDAERLMAKQAIVYDSDNIVKYTPGYYRLHSPEDIAGITVRYASGYTHKTELTGDGVLTTSAIPMHFYERKGVNTTFEILANGFTRSAATQGAIPISEPMYDPASVLYFYEGSSSTPLSRVQTQGLYLKGAKGPGLDGEGSEIPANVEATNERAAAIMVDTEDPEEDATPLYIMDIGGAILLIHDNVTGDHRSYLKYLSFDQNDANHIHDLKLTHNTHTDHAKWLMEPVNDQGITLSVHSGGDAGEYGTTYYYSTWYAPFDVLLPDDNDAKRYVAYLCDNGHSPWPDVNPGELHPQLMSVYNTEANGCPVDYRGSDKFIPANTPALIATTDNAGVVKMTVPTSAPSTVTIPNGNTFSGVFLEQKLEVADPVRDVYVFGLPFTSTLTKDVDYATSGNISGTLPEQAQTGAGFYLNANPNKEKGLAKAEWTRNNLYVLANRIYYRAAGGGGGAPDHTRDVQFVPVIFGDDEGGEEEPGGQEENENKNNRRRGDGCVYDILGRKVASEAEVKAGTWWQHLSPGIYIVDGQKVFVGVGTM